jgi:hypothetical protein
MRKMIDTLKIIVRKPEGKKPFGKYKRGWEDNIKIELKEINCGDVNWLLLFWDRDQWMVPVNKVMNCTGSTEVSHYEFGSPMPFYVKSRDSSVRIALGYGLDDWGSRVRSPGRLGIFLFTTASRTSLGPSQLPVQWIPGAITLGVKRPGREADHTSI